MAKINRKKIVDEIILLQEQACEQRQEKKRKLDVLKTSTGLIKSTVILMFLWVAVNFSYYGIIFYLPEMGGNIYISTFISGVMELPALFAVKLTFDTKLGRRLCTSVAFFLCGFAMLIIIVLPKDVTWLILAFAMAGRLFSSYVFSAVYVYTSEVYPTSIRGSFLSICSTVSRFGGVIAPYMILLSRVYIHLPELLFGILTCIAGLLTLCLNETAGVQLPDTVEQVQTKHHSSANVKQEVNIKQEHQMNDFIKVKNSQLM